MITQNHGPEEENVVGFEDDHEELEAELNAREARPNAKRLTANAPGVVANVAGGAELGEANTLGVASGSAVGGGELAESQETWFVPGEGKADAGPPVDNPEDVNVTGGCTVGGDSTELQDNAQEDTEKDSV